MIGAVFTPYATDDIHNRNWALLSPLAAIREAHSLVLGWMTSQGRFFPGGSIYGLPVWQIFDSRVSYKLYLVLLNMALVSALALLIRRYLGRRDLSVIAALVLIASMQFRYFYEGFFGFAGLVPFTVLLVLIATAGLCRARTTGRLIWAALAALPWLWAMTAYEVSFLMMPAILAVVCSVPARTPRSSMGSLGFLITPWAAVALIALWLRSRPTLGAAPAYTINLNGPVSETFLEQLSAALPSAQYLFGAVPISQGLNLTVAGVLAFVLGLPLILAFVRPVVARPVSDRRFGALVFAGAWALIVPALLASITVRWQTELFFGQGYIYLVYQSVGLAILVAALLARFAPANDSIASRTTVITVLLIGISLSLMTISSNLMYAEQWIPGPHGPDLDP